MTNSIADAVNNIEEIKNNTFNEDAVLGSEKVSVPRVDNCNQYSTSESIVKSNIEYVQIKDVKGGEYVLSLNEKTGKLEPARINGLLDMGVKLIYKLTTESGKTIRTTGNHPYLSKKQENPTGKQASNGASKKTRN